MLSSKDILERTGISRATLNNYIGYGLVPRPQVLPPEPGDAGAPRIGYFPDDTIERIENVQRLKREGWSLGRILDHFGAGSVDTEAAPPAVEPDEGEAEPSVFPPPVAPGSGSAPRAASSAPASTAAGVAGGAGARPGEAPETLAVAVLSVTLSEADELWTSLLVQEYFELANEVCGTVQGVVRMHGGRALRTSPHRLVCHFLPGPGRSQFLDSLRAARALQDAMRELSQRWQVRKGWVREIALRCGAAEGEAWVSRGNGHADDLQVVGDVGQHALLLSRASRSGSALVTRDLVARLPAADRAGAVYGIPDTQAPRAPLRLMVFTRLRDFAPQISAPRRLADLPVAELVDLAVRLPGAKGPAAPQQGLSA